MARVETFDIPKFAANGPTPSVAPQLAGTGTITVVAVASLADGDYFTLNDGVNPAVLFEYDVTGDGVTGGRTAIDVSALTTATEVRDATISAINGVGALLAITASSGGAATVNLVMDDETAGAATTENVADAGFLVTGLSEPNPAQSWGFKLVGIRSTDSTTSAAGTEGTTAAGPVTADEDNQIDVTWTDDAAWAAAGVTHVQVWLTTAPGAVVEGLVGTVAIGDQAFTYTGQTQTSVLANIPTTNTTGLGDALCVLALRDKTIQIVGTFVGTVQFQGSIDGTNWVSEGAAQTAASTALLEVSETYQFMRANMTAYTSGTPSAYLAGHRL